ncbi:hypothetical protein [uncultured Bacteroides sp.]|uniref:HipA domain-containing protein n=1 Tax=uncultured Bacteroides sp. TaxID=162156 RepID=UPI0025FAEBDA|nr:hypothetical protein [uncultured Bacteroides sp.]
MDNISLIEVFISGRRIGRMALTPEGLCGFEYDTISAAGLLHANYRILSLDYSILLKLTVNLTKDMEQVADMFRLMVFNVLISNRDDYVKTYLSNGLMECGNFRQLMPFCQVMALMVTIPRL